MSPSDIFVIPFDDWINTLVRGWLVPNFRPFFRAVQVPITQVLNGLDMVAHDALGPRRVDDEIQLIFLVIVQREVEFLLHARKQREAVALGKRRDFAHDIRFHSSTRLAGLAPIKVQSFANMLSVKVAVDRNSQNRISAH